MRDLIDAYIHRVEWYKGRGRYETLVARTGDGFELQMSVSPSGRSKQVFINGEKVWPK